MCLCPGPLESVLADLQRERGLIEEAKDELARTCSPELTGEQFELAKKLADLKAERAAEVGKQNRWQGIAEKTTVAAARWSDPKQLADVKETSTASGEQNRLEVAGSVDRLRTDARIASIQAGQAQEKIAELDAEVARIEGRQREIAAAMLMP